MGSSANSESSQKQLLPWDPSSESWALILLSFQWFLLQAVDPQVVIGIMKCLEMKSLVLKQLLLLLVRFFFFFFLPEKLFLIHVLHLLSFWVVRGDSLFQFGTEMKVFAWFIRTRCRKILHARFWGALGKLFKKIKKNKWKGKMGQEMNVKVVMVS